MSFPIILESIEDLNRTQIENLINLSSSKLHLTSNGNNWQNYKTKFQSKPIVATFFFEPSTRTKNSFLIACKRANCHTIEISKDSSSLSKGENFLETFKTLNYQGVELVIIRTSDSNFFKQFKNTIDFPMINGGNGDHQHPTQALTDLFTAINLNHIKEGQNLLIIGDIKYSRAIHSLITLFKMWNINIFVSTLEELLPSNQDDFKYIPDLNQALKIADMIYLIRPQFERHHDLEISSNQLISKLKKYQVDLRKLKNLKKFIPVYHPGPANIGTEISQDLISSNHYMGYQQIFHSVFIRMTLIEEMIRHYRNRNQMTKKDFHS